MPSESCSSEPTGVGAGRGATGSRPARLLTSVGSFPGPLCQQHMGVRERHVPRQPLRPVLLPARLGTDTDGHCCGPPPGEGTCAQRPVLPLWLCFLDGSWGPPRQCVSPFFNVCTCLAIDQCTLGILHPFLC